MASTRDEGVQIKLVPTNTAQFPGSFAQGLQQDHRKAIKSKDWESALVLYFLVGWDDIHLYKSAFIEFVGSTTLCYISALLHVTIVNYGTVQIGAYVGITNVFLITLFIYALGPASGGHINPMITFTTVLTGLTSFPRGFLYITAQTAGGALAGGLIRGSFGDSLTQRYHGGGCFMDNTVITQSQAYIIEFMGCFAILFLSFCVGFDPRQSQVFGHKLGPLLVGCIIGLVSFAGTGIAPGYPGVAANPARCFAFAVARGEFSNQWIWWVGSITGSMVLAAVYHAVPPYHREIDMEARERLIHSQPQETGIGKV